MATGSRKCTRCERNRQIAEFYTTAAGNPKGTCKECENARSMERYYANPKAWQERTRRAERKRVYGISDAEYIAMLDEQDHACAICGRKVALNVDHSHETGQVRGLCCGPCNLGLGHFRDSPDLLALAAEYLRAHD